MKLIEWNCFNEIEAYTTCREDHGRIMNMSFNGIDDQQVLENRQRLAKTLHSDLSQMVATLQQHTTRFIEVHHSDGG